MVKTSKIRILTDDSSLGKKGEIVETTKKFAEHAIKQGRAEGVENKTKRKNNKKTKKKIEKKTESQKTKETIKELPEKRLNENQVFMEPVLNSGNQKWLMITKKKIIPSDDPRPIQERLQDPIDPETQLDIQRMDPNMWECKKCGASFQHEGHPLNCPECTKQGPFKKLTEDINPDKWKLPYWEDIPQEKINMILVYDEIKQLIKNCIVFPEEIQYDLFTLWIIASYKKESFNTAPFLIFRGLISSGKTRALDLLRELGYRMVHGTAVSFPAMCRLTHFHGAGILLDELDNKISRKFESGRQLLDFLKPSYRRGSSYTVADKENQKETYTYKNFGFKAFAGETGGYDQAIFSRSIDFRMEEDYPEIPELNYIQNEINRFQTILLNYRYKFNDPPKLPMTFSLKGRHREIFAPLIRTAMHLGIDHEHIIEYVKQRKQEQIDDLQETKEYVLLRKIYEKQHSLNSDGHSTIDADVPEHISYQDLSDLTGFENQKIGYLVKKKLQLKTKRLKLGTGKYLTCLLLNHEGNEKKLLKYYRRYYVNE